MEKQSNFGDTGYIRVPSVNRKSLNDTYYFKQKLHSDYREDFGGMPTKYIPQTIITTLSDGSWLLSDGSQTDIDLFGGELRQVLSAEWPDDEGYEEKLYLQIRVLTEEEKDEEEFNEEAWWAWNMCPEQDEEIMEDN